MPFFKAIRDGITTYYEGGLPPDDAIEIELAEFVDATTLSTKPEQSTVAPDGPTLGDWRVGLVLWGRLDDVTSRAKALFADADADKQRLGKIVQERLEYSNNVFRSQLMALKDPLGFSAADVDESLWRASRVAEGDLSGQWPLTA